MHDECKFCSLLHWEFFVRYYSILISILIALLYTEPLEAHSFTISNNNDGIWDVHYISTFIISGIQFQADNIILEVYDVKGRKIETIIDKNLRSGDHNIAWDGMEYSSGIYFIRLSTPEIERKQKITLLK